METTDNAIIKLKIVTFISIIAFTSSLVFSLTTIYNKFLYMENEIEILKETVIQNDDNQTSANPFNNIVILNLECRRKH